MVKERRCNLFDDHGKPRRLKDGTKGCYRDASACRYAHPHERDWETAQSSLPPRHEAVSDFDHDFFYVLAPSDSTRDWEKEKRDRDRERDRDKGRDRDRERERAPHRKDSATIRVSPGSPSRRSTLETSMDGGGNSKRGRSPAFSVSSDKLEMLRKDCKYRTKDLPPSRQDHAPSSSRHTRSRSKDKGSERDRTDLPSQTPRHISDTHNTVRSTAQRLPPQPSHPPPMQPTPPPPRLPEVPNVPSFASTQQPPGSVETAPRGLKELSMDEQRLAWHERIDLMFTSITSRRDFTRLESDLTQLRLLSNSSLMNNLPEADRTKISAQKMALELQMEVKRKEINETIRKLVGSEYWPVLRTPQICEMEKTLGEVKKHVLEVRGLLDDVKSSCTALFKTSGFDCIPESERPSKRRKLEGKADTPGQSTSADVEDMTEDTVRELEVFRDKLTELDRHLIDLEGDVTQRDNIISDEIELHIDARLEAEDALYPPVSEPTGVSQTEIEAVVDAKNRELVRAVTVTGEEIGVLAVEVAELITKVNALEARCRVLEAENHEFKKRLVQDTLNHAKSQETLARRDKEIEAIAGALQAYISQAPAGQIAGDLPSAEYIIQSLDSQLDGLFREKFCKTLVNIQQDVFDKVEESHNRTLNTISPKIVLLLKMVNLITARLGKPDMETANAG